MSGNEFFINEQDDQLPPDQAMLARILMTDDGRAQVELAFIKIILTRFKNNEVSIEEVSNLLAIKFFREFEISEGKRILKNIKLGYKSKKPVGRGKGKTQRVIDRDNCILWSWINLVEAEPKPLRGGRTFVKELLAKKFNCDIKIVGSVITEWNAFKKSIEYLEREQIKIVLHGSEQGSDGFLREKLIDVVEGIRNSKFDMLVLEDGSKILSLYLCDGDVLGL